MTAADSLAKVATADLTGHGVILLVEDEEGLRGLNARGLSSRGYTVLQAGNGVEALELLGEEGAVDLVGVRRRDAGNGRPDAAQELRARDPKVKIIFVSGYAEEAFSKNLPSQETICVPRPNPSRSSSCRRGEEDARR